MSIGVAAVAMKTFETDFQKFYSNGSFLYDNVFVCDFDVSLAVSTITK